jgi:hypothetical protein
MKNNYLVIIIFVVIIIILAGVYFYYHSPRETLYSYKVGESEVITSTSFSSLDKESAKTLAKKAIEASKDADYKFECLVIGSAEKIIDTRDGKEFWSVAFTCNEECSKKFINCGAAVIIKNNYEVLISFPN